MRLNQIAVKSKSAFVNAGRHNRVTTVDTLNNRRKKFQGV
jgi:hypothetical protein